MNKLTIELPDGVTYMHHFADGTMQPHVDLHFDTPEAASELIERVKAAKKAFVESCESDLRVLAGVE